MASRKSKTTKKTLKPKKSQKEVKDYGPLVLKLYGRKKVGGKNRYLWLNEQIVQKELNSRIRKLDIDIGYASWLLGQLRDKTGEVISLENANEELIYLAKEKPGWKYTSEELVNLLSPKYFNKVGGLIKSVLASKSLTMNQKFLDSHDNKLKLPSFIIKSIIYCFKDAGLITISEQNRRVGLVVKKGKKSELNYDAVKYAFVSHDLLAVDLSRAGFSTKRIIKFDDIATAYNRHNEQIKAKVLKLNLKKTQVKIQHISEILFGHQDLDANFLRTLVDILKAQKPADRPDILVTTGLVQGAFQYRQKNRRPTLNTSLKGEGKQYKAAKLFLDEILSLGMKVIVNKGNDDREICEMRTVDALKIMDHQSKPQSDTDKTNISYHQLDKMKQNKAWDFHFWFQWNIVYEYMLRCGRRLYSADEVGTKYGRRIEEYFMLLETFLSFQNGDGLPDLFYEQVLDLDNLVMPEDKDERDDFIVTEDYKYEIKLANGNDVVLWDWHNSTLTPTAMIKDPTKSVRALINQYTAEGNKAPSIFATSHQQQAFGRMEGNTLVYCTPGMHKANLDKSSFYNAVSLDSSWKKLITRQELFMSGSTSVTQTQDGRFFIDFYNEKLLKKSQESKERVTLAILSDTQIGSSSMRPDLFVKVLDYTLYELLLKRPTYLFYLGDNYEGRNFKEMANQCVFMGLIQIGDQKKFFREIHMNMFSHMTKRHIQKIPGIKTLPGNHCWNSFSALTGDVFADYHADTLKSYFEGRGISVPCHYYDKIITRDGTVVPYWVGREDIANHGVLFSHQILKKGGGGKPAPYQGLKMTSETGKLLENVDLSISGHWHVAQYLMVGNKLFLNNGTTENLTPFELGLGLHNHMGNVFVHLGGGEPLQIEIVTADFLHQYEPRGFYSKDNLATLGFTDDPWFRPNKHGFARPIIDRLRNEEQRQEARRLWQSGLQKYLWNSIDKINSEEQSSF